MDSTLMSEALISLVITTTLLLGSPGPATLALAATGATVGFRRGTPFLLGILAGLSIAIIGAAAGLATLFANFSELRLAAQILGALYITYIALKIATSPILKTENSLDSTAPRFRDGFILNLLNVKAYAAFLAIFSQFLLPFDPVITGYVFTGIVCILVATVVDIIWLWFGSAISPLFSKPREARILRIVFAVLMVLAVGLVLVG
jgi:threonine/homoserine/homoserine lactone efflux protein